MSSRPTMLCCVLLAPAGPVRVDAQSPYAWEQARQIKALSEQQVATYVQLRGDAASDGHGAHAGHGHRPR